MAIESREEIVRRLQEQAAKAKTVRERVKTESEVLRQQEPSAPAQPAAGAPIVPPLRR